MIHNPNFRASGNSYKSVKQELRERNFNINLNASFGKRTDKQLWDENNGSLVRLDPYIDSLDVIGIDMIERKRSKEKDITPKDFLVNTSKINTMLESRLNKSVSLR